MPDANRPKDQEPPDALFKLQRDIEGLESFDDEEEQSPGPGPAPIARPLPQPKPVLPVRPTPRPQPAPRRSFSVFLPFVLICVGVILLLSNMGYLPDVSWDVLWRLWPLFLIGMGIDALIGRRSHSGSVIGTLLILALLAGGATFFFVLYGAQIPTWVESAQRTGWQTERVQYPLGDLTQADVSIDWISVPGRLSATRDSPNLIEGDLAVRGQLVFDVQERARGATVRLDQDSSGAWLGWAGGSAADRRWDVRLSPRLPIELVLDGGSGSGDYDLTGLQIADLELDIGSGSVELTLPAAGGYEARIEGGSGSLRITLPENVGARVELEAGSGSFRPDDRFRLVRGERDDDGVWETEDYRRGDTSITLHIDQKSGSIRIR